MTNHPDTPNLLTREEVEALMAIRPCDDVPMLSPREFNCLCKMALRYLDGQWQDISTAPRGPTVLVYYKNACGKGRTIRARFVAKHTEEDTGESDLDADYSAEKDCYYWPEGWYEEIDNWDDYSSVKIHQNLTHWQHLPSPPKEKP